MTHSGKPIDIRNRPRIGVMGPSSCPSAVMELAFQVGQGLARRGAILICGGGKGVMEAAAAGAKSEGGVTIGILPGARASDANPHIDLPIVTDLGNARNVINVLTSQAIIAIHGEAGTLSEIALAMKCTTPVVGLQTWSLVKPGGMTSSGIWEAATVEEAVDRALRAAEGESP